MDTTQLDRDVKRAQELEQDYALLDDRLDEQMLLDIVYEGGQLLEVPDAYALVHPTRVGNRMTLFVWHARYSAHRPEGARERLLAAIVERAKKEGCTSVQMEIPVEQLGQSTGQVLLSYGFVLEATAPQQLALSLPVG